MNGRKRHLLVDTMGWIHQCVVHAADISDREGAKLVLSRELSEQYPRIEKILLDGGYRGSLEDWLFEELGWKADVVKRDVEGTWLTKKEKTKPKRKFQVLMWRWIVERTHAWVSRHRRMSKDYEASPVYSESWIRVAMIGLMLRRLTNN